MVLISLRFKFIFKQVKKELILILNAGVEVELNFLLDDVIITKDVTVL